MTNVLHKIKAYLYENFLTDNPNDFVARVSSERTLHIPDICKAAVSRGGADTTAATMEHNVNLFFKEMGYQMSDGYSVNTGYFYAGALVRGVFDKATEKFNPAKHSVLFQFNQGEMLRQELPTIDVEILGVVENNVFIDQVIDVKTGTINEILTPGRNLKIVGSRLKIAGDNPNNGIFLIHQTSGTSTRVDATDIIVNKPSELIILIPTLAAGNYQLMIQTQYSPSKLLKEPKSSTLDIVLTVV